MTLAVVLTGLVLTPAQADDIKHHLPIVANVFPQGWERDATLEVDVMGEFLDRVQSVLFLDPSIKGELLESNFTRARLKFTVSAEPILVRYQGLSTQATALIQRAEIESYMLDVFDRPSRQLICERPRTSTLNQALHLISGDTVQKKIVDDDSVLTELLGDGRVADEIVEELYLRTVTRLPAAKERQFARTAIEKAEDSRRGLEDVFWALLNSKEFLYNY